MVRWKPVSKAATSGIVGNLAPSIRMALVYGGLCAGATSAKASIASSTASVTSWTPETSLAWTDLKPIAETSEASFKTPVVGSVS